MQKKLFFFFLLCPLFQVIPHIKDINSVETIISYIVFIVTDYAFCLIVYWVSCKVMNKIKWKLKDYILFVTGLVVVDQILKLIIYKVNPDFNIIGTLLKIRIKENYHQMAILNFFDIEINSLSIIFFKSLLIIFILVVFMCIKNKNSNHILAFVFLFSTGVATLVDSICWGYTLDYIYFYNLAVFDLKDFYSDVAVGLILLDQLVVTKPKIKG